MIRENAEQVAIAYRLPCTFAALSGLSSGAKLMYSVLNSKAAADGGNFVEIGARTLAKCMGVGRRTAGLLPRKLESAGLLKIVHGRLCTQYSLMVLDRHSDYIPILRDVLERRDLSLIQKLLLCGVSYWQGDDEWCWPKQKDIARDLGLPLQAVQHGISRLKAKELIQVRPRGSSHNDGNKYAVTYSNCSQAILPGPEPVPERRWSGRQPSWPPSRQRCR